MSKKLKRLEEKCARLEKTVDMIIEELVTVKNTYLPKDYMEKRDYIVRTNYIGKITDEGLLRDFKKEIEKKLGDTFDSCCNKILNYAIYGVSIFRKTLDEYDKKQIVLDTYKPKKSKAE